MNRKIHNQRCPNCKQQVRNLLVALFGVVEVNWDLDIPCRLEDYINTSLYDIMGPIHEALKKHRGFDSFVKSKKLSRADFFIPERRIIVEFDESQHFTKPRDITLSLYPSGQNFGFSVERWRTICQELDEHDNNPPYRDEQRAWYDTVKDFAPILWETGQTIRLYARDLIWCSLNVDNESDLRTFNQVLLGKIVGQ